MMPTKKKIHSLLKKFYINELAVLAGSLSDNKQYWTYSTKSRKSIAKAIIANVPPKDLVAKLKILCGKKLDYAFETDLEIFPMAVQLRDYVIGPLGFLKASFVRSRWDSNELITLLDRHLDKQKHLKEIMLRLEKKIPEEIYLKVKKCAFLKPEMIQCILAYASDDAICNIINSCIEEDLIEIKLTTLYEVAEFYSWLVTRHGIFVESKEEGIENLSNLLKKRFKEETLKAELKEYSGDYRTKLLEYCIKESPKEVLVHLFGVPELRQIAKKQGFAKIDSIDNENDIITLILLRMGFNVPPSIVGINNYISQVNQCQRDLSQARSIRQKSGVMIHAYVATERILRDLVFFYANVMWPKTVDGFKAELEDREEFTNVQREIKSIELLLKKKFNTQKTFDKLGFGEFLSILERFNNAARKSARIQRRLEKSFGRTKPLPKIIINKLLRVSSYRANFAHTKHFPGSEVCENIINELIGFGTELKTMQIYPLILRMSCEIEDEYGRTFVEAIDENGDKWTVYTRKRFEPVMPYFMHSKTTTIAVRPLLVPKIP